MLIFLSILQTGCNVFFEYKSTIPIEMVAFNGLSDEEKDLIPVSPKDSNVQKIRVNDEIESFFDKDYHKDQVYSVSFNNTETNFSGKLEVFVDLDKITVVGKRKMSK
jgi:hypothetical protein